MLDKIKAKEDDITGQVEAYDNISDCNWWHNFWGDCSQAQNERDRAKALRLQAQYRAELESFKEI